MALVYVSFSLRKRIGMKAWRRLHWTSYAIFAGATVHGLAAGTDTAAMRALAIGAVGAVAGATVWRVLVETVVAKKPRARRAAS
jgi:sulfoxide reductase heme-binding subunit YedZ